MKFCLLSSAFCLLSSIAGAIIKLVINIPDRIESVLVLPVLVYRWGRYGYAFRRIPLTQGKYDIVDAEDYKRLNRYKWCATKSRNTWYAVRKKYFNEIKKQRTIFMHRRIIDVQKGIFLDHINHNGLDNRRANLRLATHAQNSRNRKKIKTETTSKYKGVSFNRRQRRWVVKIVINRKSLHLGCFTDETEAAKAYDRAARKYHGQFAVLNFK